MSHPSAFLQTPDYAARHPQPTAATWEPRAPYVPRVPSGPANTAPLLSITREHHANRLTLTKPLLAALNLSGGAPFDLVVPVAHGGAWLLDTNPKPGAGYHVPTGSMARLRIRPIAAHHFRRPQPVFSQEAGCKDIVRNQNVLTGHLYFQLGPQVLGHPGYYLLEPVAQLPTLSAEDRKAQRRQRKREQLETLHELAAGGVASAIERVRLRKERKQQQGLKQRGGGSVRD